MTALKVKRLTATAKLPVYATPGSSGMDVCADQDFDLGPRGFMAVSTGLAFEVPEGFELQVRPRSGLAAKFGISVLNTPGTIDSDYRGEVKVILVNHHPWQWASFKSGERVAQLVLCPVAKATLEEIVELEPTVRGAGGFGSSGI